MDFETALIKNNIEQTVTYQPDQTKPEFMIDSDERVAWFAAKINNNRFRIKNQDELLAKKLKQLQEIEIQFRLEHEQAIAPYKNEITRLVTRFGMQVLHFVSSTLPKRSRSREVGGLQIGYRKKPDAIILNDEKAVIDWVTQNPEAIPEGVPAVVKLAVSKTALNQLCKTLNDTNANVQVTGATFVKGTDIPFIKQDDIDMLDLYGANPEPNNGL